MTDSSTLVAPPTPPPTRGKPKAADVFVGFMDEEVNDLLRELRRQFPTRPVIVLERAMGNRLHTGSLFETPTRFYGEGQKPDLTVLTTTGMDLPDTYEGQLARELGAALDPAALSEKLMFGKTKTADKGKVDPKLIVGRFDADKNVGGDPVFLLRCPEMGLQPELVQAYLTTILQKIKASVEGDVRLHMFGAGGAVGRNIKPGSKSRIVGSLFLGAEMFKKSERELAYRPAIKLVSMHGHAEFTHRGASWREYPFQLGDGLASKVARESAENAARLAFHKGAADGRLVSATGQTLDEAARELLAKAGTRDGTISLNVTFFGGEKEKLAGRRVGTNKVLGKLGDFLGRFTRPLFGQEPTLGGVGLSDVNMEDYHVLVAAKAAGIKPEHIRLERVNADPNAIPHAVEEKVRAAARAMRLTEDDYVQALLWGFEGSDTSLAPDAGSWAPDVFDPSKRKDRDMLVPAERVGPDKRPLMLNMFFGEIASDFISGLLEKDAGKHAFAALRKRYDEQLDAHPTIKAVVLGAFDEHLTLITAAAAVADRAARDASPELKQKVKNLVGLLGRYEFTGSSQVGQYCTTLAESGGSTLPLVKGPGGSWLLPLLWDPEGGESGRMKVWARGAVTVDELKLSPADVDRILYKGSNRPTLKLWAPKFVQQQIKLIAQGSLLASKDPQRGRRLPGSVQQLELVAERHGRMVELLHRRRKGGGGRGGSRGGSGGGAASHPLLVGSSGVPLPDPTRTTLEQHFGRDLSDVRVHTDPIAGSVARKLDAKAFTLGDHIYFAPGQYQPKTPEGMRLLGHEVAHVDQFRRGLIDPTKPHLQTTAPGGTGHALERAADEHAARIGSTVMARSGPSGVGRGPMLRAASSAESFSTALGDRIQRKPLGLLGRRGGGGGGGGNGSFSVGLRADPRRGTSIAQLVVLHRGAPASTQDANPVLELVQARGAAIRGAGAGGGMAPAGFDALLGGGGGSPLPANVQALLGSMLGADFGHVRIHTGENAAAAARSINALAFTRGRDIYFGAGQWDPHSPRGLAIIGHELTHVAQGSGGARSISAKDVRRKRPGFFQSNKAYWERVGVAGLEQGGAWGTSKAVIAALFAGFNDPFGEVRRDADPFTDALVNATGRYRGPLSYADPQRRSWEELKEFFGRTGDAAFNRAPARGKTSSGLEATGLLEAWLRVQIEAVGGTSLEEVIYQAIVFNGGNVTLAMGSLAEVLCKGRNRKWAAKIRGLHGNGKDYYLFAGAYVGLQPALTERLLGWAGSHGNIAGNPLAYSAGGALQYVAAWMEKDQRGMSEAQRLMTSRWGLEDNYNKFHEFNAGFLGASRLQRKGYEVAGHDALEEQALANERAIMSALSGAGPSQQGPPRLLALGASTSIVRRAEPAPQLRRAEAPITDRWWSRHAVALFGFGRAVWDFYKPGSRRLEELRGEVASELVTKLFERLKERRGSVAWTPYVIYTEARGLSATPREALQLSFALLVEQRDLPLAPMPGIDADEPLHDKYEHFFASAIMGHRSNALGSFAVGWMKEVVDILGTGYSEPDLMADALGAEFGQDLQVGEPAGESFPLTSGGRRRSPNLVKPLRRAAAGAREPLMGELLSDRRVARRLKENEDDLAELDAPGLPLEWSVRHRLEMTLGHDVGDLRVHTGLRAERMADALEAEAFTIGSHVVMGRGWESESVAGFRTLAHEAQHVVQAREGRLVGPDTPGRLGTLEAEAHAIERKVQSAAAAPARPSLVLREAPSVSEDLPAPELAPQQPKVRVLRKPKEESRDPIQRVMTTWAVGEMSREEFLETVTERVLELMREEVEVDSQRGATNLAWSYDAPMS